MAGLLNTLGNAVGTATQAAASALNPLALLGSAAGAVGSFLTNRQRMNFEQQEAEKQRNWNEAMQDKSNAWSLEMWNRTNEYNSPSAQLQRMQEAGLNPLYYGLDGSSANGLESAQPLGYDRASIGNLENPIASAFETAAKVAQIGNIQADTAKKANETISETTKREKMQVEIDEIKQEIQNKIANEKLTDTQREKLQKDIDWLDRLNEAAIAEKDANAALSKSQKQRIDELLEGEKLIQVKTFEDFEHRWSKISAEISKMAVETGILREDLENYALNHANNGFMGTGVSIQNLIRARIGERNGNHQNDKQRELSNKPDQPIIQR